MSAPGAMPSSLPPKKSGRRKLLLGGAGSMLVGGAWLKSAGQRSAVPEVLPTAPIPRDYFGLHIHRADTTTPWPAASFGSWRLWDTYTTWPHLEPEPGQWDFRRLDTYVNMAQKAGVGVLLPLGLSPVWASARPDEPSSYRPGNAAEPARMEDWRRYVRKVAERYKGRIAHYEVWNEVNLKNFYSGSLESLLELVRIAHEEVRQADPHAQMVTPSVTGLGDSPKWLDRYLELGGGKYADVVGYHFYSPKDAPEAALPTMVEVQSIMRRHGLSGKPLWNTEAGWWIENLKPTARTGAAEADWRKLDQDGAQAYVARALVLAWVFGVSRYYWYAWDNLDMGLFDAGAGREKPAAAAYARVAQWLTGQQVVGCTHSAGTWTCELKDRHGRPARLAWRENGSDTPWVVPAAWQATTQESLAGVVRPANGPVSLGQMPVLFR